VNTTNTEQGRSRNWDQTSLWSELQKRTSTDAEAVRAVLVINMPQIEQILSAGGTSPLDFTLHDAGHAFRVAERMSQIIPADVLPQLSVYELALLLLSAYLHDIGMTPERRSVQSVYRFLLTGDHDKAWATEQKELEKWLNENHPDIARPLDFRTNPQESLLLANEIVTNYCRHRHNDWSEDWIRKNLSDSPLSTYSGWIGDLVNLCRSHHESYVDLIADRFNPRYVGAPSTMVHLRYLAAALRIADVLELDPERTPSVILRHRDIRPSSLIYWWKDAAISIKQEVGNLSVYARPQDARIHRAVEITVDQINTELLTCRKLADVTHFENCPASVAKLPHRWELPSAVTDDIRPRDNSYEYIDGSFRPDTRKLLQLLSGVELYGTEMVAVRELLQNAFDAVREQIAYERLASANAAGKSVGEQLAELNRVELRLEFSADGTWLLCKDTGVGMTKSIIRDHLLVSGVGARHDVLELERKCDRAGFSLGRTGQFGIGVLSYFMIADQVVIRTKRSPLPGDSEADGWQFETEGVGSFGELRSDRNITKGTEVKLHLKTRKNALDPATLYKELLTYVKDTILRIPCQLSLASNAEGCQPLELRPGFTRSRDDLSAIIVGRTNLRDGSSDNTPLELLSTKKRLERQAGEKYWGQVRTECHRHLQFDREEGDIPGGLGHYRIHLPYFKFPEGASLAFLRPVKKNQQIKLEKIGRGYCFLVAPFLVNGWKGMDLAGQDISPHYRYGYPGFSDSELSSITEVDWCSSEAGIISVSRHTLDQTEKAKDSLRWLSQRCTELRNMFLKKNKKSAFNTLNRRLVETGIAEDGQLNWITFDPDKNGTHAVWGAVRPPFLNALAFPYDTTNRFTLKWNSKHVAIVASLREQNDEYPHQGLAWCGANSPPEMVVARVAEAGGYPRFGLSPFWATTLHQRPSTHVAGLTCPFPSEWIHLCGVSFKMYSADDKGAVVWNPANSLVNSVNASAWEWSREKFITSLDPLPHKASLLADKGKASSWVLLCLQQEQRELWEGLRDRDPAFMVGLWSILFEARREARTSNAIYQWVEDASDSRLRILTPGSWTLKTQRNSKDLHEFLPVPPPEWCVFVADQRFTWPPKMPK